MQALVVFFSFNILVNESLTLLLRVAIFTRFLIGTLVQWRCSDVEMSVFNDLRHKAIEECHDESVDVRTVDIGIGHNDNLVISQFIDIGFSVIFALNTKADTDALNDIHDRLGFENTMPLHLFYVQNLTSKRQNCLCITVATLLGRASRRVSLDEEYLAFFRVFIRAIGQFPRQTATCHHALSLYTFTCLASCNACCCG